MRALLRMAAIVVAGAALYYARLVNSIVIQTWRSLFSYFFLIPLFALPVRRLALVARRRAA